MKEYETSQSGPLAVPMFDIVGICKTRPEHERPNAQLQIAPFSMRPFEPGKAVQLEKEPGISCLEFVLRPDSEGSIRITAADPDAPPAIDANYLATDHETVPGSGVQTDDEVIDAWLLAGGCGYHAIGTCAMGPVDDDVVDAQLKVRGTTNLRVVDASVLPIRVSGNLNGPVTALAWHAADLMSA